ncbi:hypothetical protein [Tunicatimonas pelagia]|uniref:hypothetical protein n=1 Tax=Tunicatimonas pelagia TaxID=931531 RepID=UPI0026661881|nr:hypothetical protein [Tunicatimonas pelagia]WKN42997.1 hypothetical protein P0M28_28565 [Tunicatimonas pelagia]
MKTHHTLFHLLSTATLAVGLLFTSCSEDDNSMTDGNPSGIRTSGFVIVGNTASNSSLVKYVEELPTGTIDLSDGTDFSSFDPRALYDHALFVTNPDPSGGFAKYIVNEAGELVEAGTIPTVDANPFRLSVRDADVGVFQDLSTPNQITVFNPTTLAVTSTIDMSEGFVLNNANQRYTQFYFRGDELFASIDNWPTEFTSFIVHQANLATNTFEGETQRDGNGTSTISQFTNYLHLSNLDEAGNLYLPDGGNYQGEGIPGRINRIPAGSDEIDPDYVFEPALELNPQNVFLPTFNHFYVTGNGQAIARVNAETPQAAIDIVTAAGGVQNLSDDQTQAILGILFSAASARWCILDLNAQTVTPITGIPPVTVFTRRDMFEHDGQFYLPVVVGGENAENAYYRYDPSTGAAEKAFDVTGADLVGVFNLANNN